MRNIKFMLTFLCLLMSILFFTVTMGFADDDDPEGFRGIKWGTNIKNLSNMSPCKPSDVWKRGYVFGQEEPRILPAIDVETYLRTGDNLAIGQVPLDRIEYAFWHGRFIGVGIFYNKRYHKLMDSQFRTMFGEYDSPLPLTRRCTKTLFYQLPTPYPLDQATNPENPATVFMMSPSLTKEREQQIKNEDEQKNDQYKQNLKQQF